MSRSALAIGLCALIPLPWLDQAVARAVLRGTLDLVAEQERRPLGSETLTTLTEDRSSLLLGCLGAAIFWPLRKLFRTALYFLTIKDAVDWAIVGAMRAEMVRVAVVGGFLPHRAAEVRDLMDATLDRYRISPLTRWALRMDRPPMAWRAEGDVLARLIGWLLTKGGGGVVLPDFAARLKLLPAPEERQLLTDDGGAGEE